MSLYSSVYIVTDERFHCRSSTSDEVEVVSHFPHWLWRILIFLSNHSAEDFQGEEGAGN
jgi:hypothetical protein